MRIFFYTCLFLLFAITFSYAETVRVVQRADGGVSVLTAGKGYTLDYAQNDNPALKGRPYKDMDKSDIPSDRKYRNAWKLGKDEIVIDGVKKEAIDSKLAIKTLQERIIELEEKVNTLQTVK